MNIITKNLGAEVNYLKIGNTLSRKQQKMKKARNLPISFIVSKFDEI